MSTAGRFVHLHCHSHYSLLDGASPIDALVEKAKAQGMDSLALTDHGNLYGALEFYEAAKTAGINPIIGYEAYIAPGSRFQKDVDANQEASYHLTLLAQNRVGFQNLIALSSSAFLEGFYRKPRIDKELLAAHSEGLICLSGCVSGELSRTLLRGGAADRELVQARDIVGLVPAHLRRPVLHRDPEQRRRDPAIGARSVGRPGQPHGAAAGGHERRALRESRRFRGAGRAVVHQYRALSHRHQPLAHGRKRILPAPPAEMYAAFPGLEGAVARSQQIADTVSIELELGKRHFPTFDVPGEQTSQDYLRSLCMAGLKERYAREPEYCREGELAPVVLERLDRELEVINTLGFPNYFLIVWDFVRFARDRGIPATARGSGVGSLVAYALHLSHVCPLKYDLLFERFLDISRREAPDIDIDFCKDRRGEVIAYVKEKYGSENVAQIGTFGTLAARAAIRDVGRALGLPIPRVDGVVAMVPETLGIELKEALEASEDLKLRLRQRWRSARAAGPGDEDRGAGRNVGTHAAAVVIADRPLTDYVPLQRVQGKEEVITQWAMGDVERAGLLKMDFLGLRNLTILSKAVELIRADHRARSRSPSVPARRSRNVRPALPRRDEGDLSARKRRHSRSAAADEAGSFPRHHRHERPVSSRPARRGHGRRLHPGQARPQAGRVQAPGDEGHPGRDPRRDGLPGAGDADLEPLGGHRAVERLFLHQGDQQEEAADDRQVPRGVHRRRREPGMLEEARRTSCSA